MILEPVVVPELSRTSGRKADPNPFIDGEFGDVIRAMPVDPKPGEPGAYNVQVPGLKDLKTNKEFAKVAKQLRDAGAKRGVTIRQLHTQVTGADDKPSVNIQFWAIKLIVRITKEEKAKRDAEVAAQALTEAAEAAATTPAPKAGK